MESLLGAWKGYYTYNKKYYKNKEFVKTYFTITIKTRITDKNRRHPNIYYSGILKGNEVEDGSWKFKLNVLFVAGKLFLGAPANGSWTMEKII